MCVICHVRTHFSRKNFVFFSLFRFTEYNHKSTTITILLTSKWKWRCILSTWHQQQWQRFKWLIDATINTVKHPHARRLPIGSMVPTKQQCAKTTVSIFDRPVLSPSLNKQTKIFLRQIKCSSCLFLSFV